jgi:hypothetical protein
MDLKVKGWKTFPYLYQVLRGRFHRESLVGRKLRDYVTSVVGVIHV